MGLLDKLKPQPRWKHADPSVRLEAVRELEDQAELAILAELDPDARVRRSATARIADPSVLGRIAAADADPEARDRAADRLLALATLGGLDEASALAAVAALSDVRRLSVIAKSDAAEPVRGSALARVTDQRALSSIARHAKQESTATAALDRLTDAADLVDVAQNGDHRDVALRAFERLVTPSPDVALLQTIEARSQHKAVSRRARTVIQEIETAEAARRAAEEERRRREAAVIEDVERLAGMTDLSTAKAELLRLNDAWQGLGVTDDLAQNRFVQAVGAAEAAITRREREAEEAAERARMRAEAIATRDALCQRVETLEGDDLPAQLAVIEEEWRSLLPLVGDGPEADRLAARFAQAVAACRKRHEMSGVLAETRARLEALVAEAEGLPSQATRRGRSRAGRRSAARHAVSPPCSKKLRTLNFELRTRTRGVEPAAKSSGAAGCGRAGVHGQAKRPGAKRPTRRSRTSSTSCNGWRSARAARPRRRRSRCAKAIG